MMASLEEGGSSELVASEKQDVCHLATMLMEVGMSLAQLSEEDATCTGSNITGPAVKKKRVVWLAFAKGTSVWIDTHCSLYAYIA